MTWKMYQPVILILVAASILVAQTGSPLRNNQQSFEERIAKALRNEVGANRDQELINVAFDQELARLHSDAKATIWKYVEDKDWGFACLVTALVGQGQFEDARSTLELIGNLERRVIAFVQIGEAQAKAGNLTTAKQTLQDGLEDAQKEKNLPYKKFTLPLIIGGMAATGLNEEARNTLKLLDKSDLLNGYLTVAIVQAQRGDLEEARWAFRQALQIARKGHDAWELDSTLNRIAEAQADAGLIQDAKETAAMIKSEEWKASAAMSISWAEKRRGNGTLQR